MKTSSTEVAVIGTGLMGSALARTLLTAGRSVAVWNRTATRTEALVARGAITSGPLAEVVMPARNILICMSSYADVYEHFRVPEVERALSGKVVTNVITGTADEAREMQAWMTARGASYLDGIIIVYPDEIGAPHAAMPYAGARETWDEQADLLRVLGGRSYYLGEFIAGPNVLLNSMGVWFYNVAHIALMEAMVYAIASGLELETIEQSFDSTLELLRHSAARSFGEIRSGVYTNEEASLGVISAAVQLTRKECEDSARPHRTLLAASEILKEAVADGDGTACMTHLFTRMSREAGSVAERRGT